MAFFYILVQAFKALALEILLKDSFSNAVRKPSIFLDP